MKVVALPNGRAFLALMLAIMALMCLPGPGFSQPATAEPPVPPPVPGLGGMTGQQARALCVDGASCLLTGQRARQGLGGEPVNPVRAATMFRAGCVLGEGAACTDLGVLLATGNGVERSDTAARVLFQIGCADESLLGCFNFAHMLAHGRGGAADRARATELLRTTCGRGLGAACYNAGSAVQADDPALATRYQRRACHLGVNRGCSALQIAAANEEDQRRFPMRAMAVEQAECARGSIRGCNSVGWLASIRGSADFDLDVARAALERGCTLGGRIACYNWGTLLAEHARSSEDYSAARDAWGLACGKRHWLGCTLLAESWVSSGEGVLRPDYAFAGRMWMHLCSQGQGDACTEAAQWMQDGLLQVPADGPKPRSLFAQGCRLGSLRGCYRQAELDFARGRQTLAMRRAGRACDLGHAGSCLLLAGWARGSGAALSQRRRQSLYRQACINDPLDQVACGR